MITLVCGSRNFNDRDFIWSALSTINITEIIEGEARGVDTLARLYGEAHEIPVRPFPADWKAYGRAAGPIRNKKMLDEGQPDLVVAFLTPESVGTRNMLEQARKAGIPTRVFHVEADHQ